MKYLRSFLKLLEMETDSDVIMEPMMSKRGQPEHAV